MARPKYPKKLRNINNDHLKKLVIKGWSDEEICEFFGINQATYWRWRARFPQFASQIDYWKTLAVKKIEKRSMKAGQGYFMPEEKIFVHMQKTYDQYGNTISEQPLITRVPTRKWYPPNITAAITTADITIGLISDFNLRYSSDL